VRPGEHADAAIASWKRPIIALLLFFPTGLVVLRHTLASRREQRDGELRAAKVSMLKARHWMTNTIVSAVSALVIGLAVTMFVANDFAIKRSFLDLDVLGASMPRILRGFWLNVRVFMIAEVTVVTWSLIVAILRSLPGRAARPIRFLMVCYVDLFRGLPELLVIFLVVFGLHQTGLPVLSGFSDFQAIILAITLTYGAYLGEVIRGAMEGVHPSQVAAARSLGLTHGQTLRHIVVPTAMRSITVPLLNSFISLQKTTALVSIVGLLDAVNYAQVFTFQKANLSPLTGAALCFVVITVPLTRFADRLMKRDVQRLYGGGR